MRTGCPLITMASVPVLVIGLLVTSTAASGTDTRRHDVYCADPGDLLRSVESIGRGV